MQVPELDPLLLPISSPPWNLRVHDRKKCMPLHGPKHPIDYLCQSVTIILGTSVHQRVKSCAYIIMICYDCSLYDLQYCQCVLLANSCNLKGGTSYFDLCSKDIFNSSEYLHCFLSLLIVVCRNLIRSVISSEYFGSPKKLNIVLVCRACSNFQLLLW